MLICIKNENKQIVKYKKDIYCISLVDVDVSGKSSDKPNKKETKEMDWTHRPT